LAASPAALGSSPARLPRLRAPDGRPRATKHAADRLEPSIIKHRAAIPGEPTARVWSSSTACLAPSPGG